MSVIVFIVCSLIISVAAAFHFYWGFGGKVGLGVSLPQLENGQPIMKHNPLAAHAVGLALAAGLLLVFAYMGVFQIPVPKEWLRAGVGLLSFAFTARALSWYKYVGLLKKVHHTAFAKYDTYLYSPLCLLEGLGLLYLLIGV